MKKMRIKNLTKLGYKFKSGIYITQMNIYLKNCIINSPKSGNSEKIIKNDNITTFK